MGTSSPMRLPDVIKYKREGGSLEEDQISFFIDGVVKETVDSAQIGAMLMAIYFRYYLAQKYRHKRFGQYIH